MKPLFLALVLLMLLPGIAKAQSAPIQYGPRIPAKVQGWYAPVASNLIGSHEQDHLDRGSVNAWDWSAAVGSPVFAIGPGRVTYAGCNDAGHYGCWVRIDHGGGYESSSAHCAENSIQVRSGQTVDASTQICSIGRTGWTSWPHVHLVIKYNGVHQKIDRFFDVRLVHYCHFTRCQATNDPHAPVAAQGIMTAQMTQQSAPTAHNALQRILATVTAEQFATLVTALVTLLMLAWWLFGLWVRVVIVAATTTVVALCIALLFLPGMPVQAGQQSAPVGGDTWKAAYSFMRKWEGARCVHDPVRTFKGITNGTYNTWRRDQGMGLGDVCRDLTEQQAEAIYYQRYWLASGADRLSTATAIAVFDHAVNAGVGSAKGLLSQCGDNAQCVIQARFADYRTKRNFPQYGRAWFNRVNDMISFLKLVK